MCKTYLFQFAHSISVISDIPDLWDIKWISFSVDELILAWTSRLDSQLKETQSTGAL